MPKPSVSAPEELLKEVDDRRHSTKDRSEWIREAMVARLIAEDDGSWTNPGDEWPRDEALTEA